MVGWDFWIINSRWKFVSQIDTQPHSKCEKQPLLSDLETDFIVLNDSFLSQGMVDWVKMRCISSSYVHYQRIIFCHSTLIMGDRVICLMPVFPGWSKDLIKHKVPWFDAFFDGIFWYHDTFRVCFLLQLAFLLPQNRPNFEVDESDLRENFERSGCRRLCSSGSGRFHFWSKK